MVWPASQIALAKQFNDLNVEALHVRKITSTFQGQMAAGNISANALLTYYTRLTGLATVLANAQALFPMGDYARAQFDQNLLEVDDEFTSLQATLAALTAAIELAIPATGGWLDIIQFSAGSVSWRSFTPAETADLRAAMQGLIDGIS